MKTKLFSIFAILLIAFSLNSSAQKKVRLNKFEKKIIKRVWVLDTLKYDEMNNFKPTNRLSYHFDRDSNKKDKLAYSKTTGEGLFSEQVLGWWRIKKKVLVLREWNSELGEEREPEYFDIIEISKTELIFKSEDGIFFPFYLDEEL